MTANALGRIAGWMCLFYEFLWKNAKFNWEVQTVHVINKQSALGSNRNKDNHSPNTELAHQVFNIFIRDQLHGLICSLVFDQRNLFPVIWQHWMKNLIATCKDMVNISLQTSFASVILKCSNVTQDNMLWF